jgi:hypothetical protein
MNNSKTPKVVIGVGLVAVYTSVAFYLLRDKPMASVAQSATAAPSAQIADATVPPPAIAPSLTDVSPGVTGEPPVVTAAPAPVARAPASRAATTAPLPKPVDAKVQAQEPVRASTGDVAAIPVGEAPLSSQAEAAPLGQDRQITADVRTQIAAVAPASTIDVTTTDGVVELSGSVPTREEIDKVLLATLGVAHVRDVDASALMVGN